MTKFTKTFSPSAFVSWCSTTTNENLVETLYRIIRLRCTVKLQRVAPRLGTKYGAEAHFDFLFYKRDVLLEVGASMFGRKVGGLHDFSKF